MRTPKKLRGVECYITHCPTCGERIGHKRKESKGYWDINNIDDVKDLAKWEVAPPGFRIPVVRLPGFVYMVSSAISPDQPWTASGCWWSKWIKGVLERLERLDKEKK